MKVFISWSGPRSRTVAEALASWLRQVLQALDPWVSLDIRKGARWGPEIAGQLENTRVGIICLTRDNLNEPWILFEAGALSKTKDALVATFLLDVEPTDVKPPLSQFQHTAARKEEVRQLIWTLNAQLLATGGRALPDADLEEVFELFWPRLQEKLSTVAPLPTESQVPIRTDSDILREVLDLVRNRQTEQGSLFPVRMRALVSPSSATAAALAHTYDVVVNSEVEADKVESVLAGFPNTAVVTKRQRDGKLAYSVTTSVPSMVYLISVLHSAGIEAVRVTERRRNTPEGVAPTSETNSDGEETLANA